MGYKLANFDDFMWVLVVKGKSLIIYLLLLLFFKLAEEMWSFFKIQTLGTLGVCVLFVGI